MNICRVCGIAANVLTCLAKYDDMPKALAYEVSTMHLGTCDICQRSDISVTEQRDYFYPDFRLINKAAWRRALREFNAKQ